MKTFDIVNNRHVRCVKDIMHLTEIPTQHDDATTKERKKKKTRLSTGFLNFNMATIVQFVSYVKHRNTRFSLNTDTVRLSVCVREYE